MKQKRLAILACALAVLMLAGCAAGADAGMPNGLANYPAAQGRDEGYVQEAAPLEDAPVDWDTEEYDYQKENSFVSVAAQPFATFAADVDTASYSNFRRQLLRNETVRPDSVRVEEMINYFRYDYPEPKEGEPFSVTLRR